jgi:tetratricopeptide (TPR) repeat protein
MALVQRAHEMPAFTIQTPPISTSADNGGAATLPGHTTSFTDPFAGAANSTTGAANSTPLPAQQTLAASSPAPALALTTPTPAASAPATESSTAPTNFVSLPKPTPVDQQQIIPSQSRLDALLAEAVALNARGDTSTAVTRLREALALSPKNPQIISQLAVTYEKMDLQDKALEQWRAIYDLGESAGIYYQAADAKLKAAEVGGAGESTPAPNGPPVAAADNGFQEGSMLALTDLSIDEKPETSEGYKRFTLKIPVKRRPNISVNVQAVTIQVFFYDQLGNAQIVRTNADVNYHWNSLPADWVQDDIEILDVDYTQIKAEPGEIEAGRHYYGYVVCLYYNNQLQDQAADPMSLLKTYPPPLTLQDQQQH